jgi:hypothetical protein
MKNSSHLPQAKVYQEKREKGSTVKRIATKASSSFKLLLKKDYNKD